MSVTHIAGPVITIGDRKIQRCSVCGEKLNDNLAILLGRLAAIGEPPKFLSWPVGEPVRFDGPAQFIVPHKDGDHLPPDCCIALVED